MALHPTANTVSVVLQVVYCCIGLAGNCLSAIVFSRKKLRGSYTYLLLGLTTFDTLTLIKGILYNGKALGLWSFDVGHVTQFFFRWICDAGVKYCIVSIAFERFFVVWRPLHAYKLRENSGKLASLLLVLVVVIIPSVSYLYHVYEVKGYLIYLSVVLNFVPFTLVVTFSLGIHLGLRKFAKERKKLTTAEHSEAAVTRMLLVVTGVFGLCCFFEVTRRILMFSGYYDFVKYDYYDYISTHLSDHFYLINSSANFIIYGVMSKSYREEAIRMFGCSRDEKHSAASSSCSRYNSTVSEISTV